eukprot:PhF_6_TR1409/c0_g1_i1/m.2448
MAENQRIWQKFLQELQRMHVDFETIRHCDDKSRGQMLEHMSLNPVERAVVSSLWAQAGGGEDTGRGAPIGGGMGGGGLGMAGGSIPNPQGTAMRGNTATRSIQELCDISRAALNRGDATVALSLTTELLDRDPYALVYLLHEFMPHVPPEQLGQLLGFDMHSTTQAPHSPVRAIGHQQVTESMVNTAMPATINGIPVRVGEVITAHSLSAQYGVGFIATCNDVGMVFPHCVQPGDVIRITAASGGGASFGGGGMNASTKSPARW